MTYHAPPVRSRDQTSATTSENGTNTIQATYTKEKISAAKPTPNRLCSTVAGSWPRNRIRSRWASVPSHRLRFTNGTKLLRFRNAA